MDLIPTNREEQTGEVKVTETLGERDCVMLEVVTVNKRNAGCSQAHHFYKADSETFRSINAMDRL